MKIDFRNVTRFQKIVRFFKLMGLIASIPFIFIAGILWVIIVIYPVVMYDLIRSFSSRPKYDINDITKY